MDDMEESEFSREIDVALEAARKAGTLMDEYRGNDSISYRKDGVNDIVTEADRACQEKIVETISREFPEDDFKGEEDLKPEGGTDRVWVIDPIDGTTNFHSGWTYFCTSIALRTRSGYSVGVVHSPSSGIGKTWMAVKGEGAYVLNEGESLEDRTRIRVSERSDLRSSFFTCFQSPDNDERRAIEREVVSELTSRDMNYRECGSGALTLPEIAEGGLDARFDFVDEWDYAAASLILEEAGGSFEKIGERFGKDTVIATNGKIHGKFKTVIQEVLSGS
jgi:myo-inositol-1(or 4)-monophosphatase